MIPKRAMTRRLSTTALESSGVVAVVLLWKALVRGWTGAWRSWYCGRFMVHRRTGVTDRRLSSSGQLSCCGGAGDTGIRYIQGTGSRKDFGAVEGAGGTKGSDTLEGCVLEEDPGGVEGTGCGMMTSADGGHLCCLGLPV